MKTANHNTVTRAVSNLFAVIAAGAILAACGSNVKVAEKSPVEERAATAVDTSRNVAPVVAPTVSQATIDAAYANKGVYFDYDSYIVKDEYRALVEAHAKFLNANKSRKVVLQGNADERGGSEYNLALGQKRAEAVRKSLVLLGVAESQIEAVSFGKEKPRALGHDEAAYAENRRVDFAY